MADVSIWVEAVPTWVNAVAAVGAAVATIGALVAAVLAGKTAGRLLSIEQRRERDRDRDRRSAQAALVSAWPIVAMRHVEQTYDDWVPMEHWGVALWNASKAPVYQVVVSASGVPEGEDTIHVSVLPPSEEAARHAFPHMNIGEAAQDPDIRSGLQQQLADLKITVEFRDAEGRFWLRKADGELMGGDEASQSHRRWQLGGPN